MTWWRPCGRSIGGREAPRPSIRPALDVRPQRSGGSGRGKGNFTPVSSSDTSHSFAAVFSSRAAGLDPTGLGWPRCSNKPSGPT